MPRGGARVNSGPAPDPNALRRDKQYDRDGWTDLPAGGFTGSAPNWPLDRLDHPLEDLVAAITESETARWALIWRTPQAAVWARLGWSQDVALYVRWMSLAERGDMKAAAEARQWSDRLGLNPAAMMRNRWRIPADQVGEKRTATRQRASAARTSVRARLEALDGGGA